jgi:hypothetical protein
MRAQVNISTVVYEQVQHSNKGVSTNHAINFCISAVLCYLLFKIFKAALNFLVLLSLTALMSLSPRSNRSDADDAV